MIILDLTRLVMNNMRYFDFEMLVPSRMVTVVDITTGEYTGKNVKQVDMLREWIESIINEASNFEEQTHECPQSQIAIDFFRRRASEDFMGNYAKEVGLVVFSFYEAILYTGMNSRGVFTTREGKEYARLRWETRESGYVQIKNEHDDEETDEGESDDDGLGLGDSE